MDDANQAPADAETMIGAAETVAPDSPHPPPLGPENDLPRRGLRIWFVVVNIGGIGGLLVGQPDLAALTALAGMFAVAQAADANPRYGVLHELLAWVIPLLCAVAFVGTPLLLATSAYRSPSLNIGSIGIPSLVVCVLGALVSIACLWPPVSRSVAELVFRARPSSRTERSAAPLILTALLFAIPGHAMFRAMSESGALGDETLLGAGSLWSNLVGLTLLALAGTGFLVRRDFGTLRRRLGLVSLRGRDGAVIVIGFAALFGLNAGVEFLQRSYAPAAWQSDQEVSRMLVRHLSRGEMLLLGVSAGVGEELAMRGALQPRLGLFATSLLFAALHVQYSWIGMSVILLLGILLGTIRRTAGTTAAIVVHGLYDFCAAITTSPVGR